MPESCRYYGGVGSQLLGIKAALTLSIKLLAIRVPKGDRIYVPLRMRQNEEYINKYIYSDLKPI